jgi:hypothetical protein
MTRGPKPNIKKAKRHLARLRKLVSKKPTRLLRMSEAEVFKAVRKSREEIWDRKLAARF